MAVLTADKTRPVRLPAGGITTRVVTLAGYTNFAGGSTAHTVYKGSVVVCDVSDTDGYFRAAPLTSSTAAAGGDLIGGVALENVKVTTVDTSDGAKKVTVAVSGVWGFPTACAITDLGADIYTSDDGETVTTTSTNNFWIGKLVDTDSTYDWVDISFACGMVNAPPAA